MSSSEEQKINKVAVADASSPSTASGVRNGNENEIIGGAPTTPDGEKNGRTAKAKIVANNSVSASAGRKRKATNEPGDDNHERVTTSGSGVGMLLRVSKRFKSAFSKLLSQDGTSPRTSSISSPSQILSSQGCTAQTLTVSDQHATLLLSSYSKDNDQQENKSILKLTLVPFHRETLGSNPVFGTRETLQPELKLLENNPQASSNIICFLQSYDFHLKSESGAEYSYYDATPSSKSKPKVSSSSAISKAGSFSVELISPASERQIKRSMPSHALCLVEETPQMYNEVVKPYIQSIVDGGKSLNWIYNIIEGKKEQERLLVNTDTFIVNIDTKWRSHPDAFATPREEWYQHKSVEDLYCLGIFKQRDVATMRDLTVEHVPILKSMKTAGLEMIEKLYGVSQDQIRVFVHYQPQFFHFHVHFTRLQNEIGAVVERGHLVSDIIQNLEMDGNYYRKRTISYKLKVSSPLYLLIQNSGDNDKKGEGETTSSSTSTTVST